MTRNRQLKVPHRWAALAGVIRPYLVALSLLLVAALLLGEVLSVWPAAGVGW